MQLLAAAIAAATLGQGVVIKEPRFEVGVRAGFGVPTGQFLVIGHQDALLPRVDRAVPLWVEAGYHMAPAVVVGPYFQYSFGRANTPMNVCPPATNCSSSAHVVRAGAQFQYRFLTESMLNPWVGGGAGLLWHSGQFRFTLNGLSATGSSTQSGFDLNVQAGADARLGTRFAVGLYGALFSGESAGVEGGLRARFGL